MDATRGKDIREWAVKTGRFETLHKLRRLNSRPQAKQFCEKYVPEWPDLKELVAKATATKSTGQKVAHRLKSTFTFNFPHDPQDNGFMDHMVRITTSIHSPLVVTGCRPLCPSSPPEIGKRRLAVPEMMQVHPGKKPEEHVMRHNNGSISVASTSVSSVSLGSCCSDSARRGSVLSMASNGVRKFVPRSMARRNSVFPTGCVPQIKVTKSGEPMPKKPKKKKLTKGYLEPPIWKYKEAKEEKKKEKKKKEQEKRDKEANNKATKWINCQQVAMMLSDLSAIILELSYLFQELKGNGSCFHGRFKWMDSRTRQSKDIWFIYITSIRLISLQQPVGLYLQPFWI